MRDINKSAQASAKTPYLGQYPVECPSIHRQHDSMLLRHPAQIQNSVAHPPQRGIDADSRHFCYLLETEVLIKAHMYYFPLFVRQMFHQATYIRKNLVVHYFSFNRSFGQSDIIQ